MGIEKQYADIDTKHTVARYVAKPCDCQNDDLNSKKYVYYMGLELDTCGLS